jgi:copper chaperone CopZ
MEKTSVSTIGGIVTAVVASLCCIGPVVLTLLGIGSIGAFAVFERYRPYLVGATLLLLGAAFYFTYRKREVQCADGTCKVEQTGKWNKIGVWGATIVAAIALAFPYFGVAPSAPANLAVEGKAIVTLSIEGMDCKACANGVEGSLAGFKGVRKARVEYEQGKAIVEYDPAMVQPGALVDHINESGFIAKVIDQKKGE